MLQCGPGHKDYSYRDTRGTIIKHVQQSLADDIEKKEAEGTSRRDPGQQEGHRWRSQQEGASAAQEGDEEETEEAEEGESEEEPEMKPEPVTYAAGSFIIPGAQRGRPALIDLLEPRAPEIKYQYRDGPVQDKAA